MTRHGKPNGGSADAGHRDALERIARLIAVSGDDEPGDNAGPDGGGDTRENTRLDALSLASLQEPGASQLLEALPAGLAVCSGDTLLRANSAFALAFGYRSAGELEDAGGLKAIFPGEMKALAKTFARSTDSPPRPVELQARSRSGREFRVPVAVHAIESGAADKAHLVVLHPQGSALGGAGVDATPPTRVKTGTPRGEPAATGGKQKSGKKKRAGRAPKPASPGVIERMNKTDFLAKVSHEVRTPLNSIIGFAEIMKEEQLGPIGNDRYRGYIRDIHESGLYALSLVNDLLDISKIESGEFELNFTAVDLEEVAAESVQSMQPQAQRQRVLLRTSFAEGLPGVLADRRTIKQIILNLVSNAIKFTKPGGQVIVSTQATGAGGVRIRVRDTGVGMSKSEIAVALQPFQQLDTAPRNQMGTGLGLPLTKALVEANRARFKLRSVSDAGTRIDVTFPSERVARTAE